MPKHSTQDTDAAQADQLLIELAHLLLEWSWEGTLGLEETLRRVAHVYDRPVQATFSADSAIITIGDRVELVNAAPAIPPLAALSRVDAWLGEVEAGKVASPAEARRRLREIAKSPGVYSPPLRVLGVVLLSMAFAVDIVGTWEGVWVAGVTGIISGLFLVFSETSAKRALVAPLLAAFFVGLPIMLARGAHLVSLSPGLLAISALFVFIPGDSITIQAVEVAAGRWTAGAARMFASCMLLILLVSGVVAAGAVSGVPLSAIVPDPPGEAFALWAAYPGHIVFTIGVALSFQMRPRDIPLATLVTLAVTAVGQGTAVVVGGTGSVFLASVAMTVLAILVARPPGRSPTLVWILTPFFTLTPGSHGMRGIESLIGHQQIEAVHDFASLVATLIAIALGILIGVLLMNRYQALAR